MAENLYFMGSGYLGSSALTGSTAGPTSISTNTAGKTAALLQLATPAGRQIAVVEYGVSLSGAPSAAQLTLIATSLQVSTVSAGAVAGIIFPYNNANAPASALGSGISSCAYYTGPSALPAGTVAALFDEQLLTTNTYVKQFPLAREPVMAASSFLQICINVPTTAVNAYCYVVWRE